MNSAVQLPKDRKHVVYQDLVALLTLASQAASTGSEDVDFLMVFVAEHLSILLSKRSSRVAWKNTRLEPANGPKNSKNRPAAKNKAVLRGPCQLAGFKMIYDPRGSKFPR